MFESNSFSPYWAATNAMSLPGSQQRNSNSTININDTLTNGSNDDAALQGAGTTARSWYVSFWWKVDPAWVWGTTDFSGTHKWLSNIKIIRFWNPSGSSVQNVYLAFVGFDGGLYFLKEGITGAGLTALHVSPAQLTLNTWHQFRYQFVDSSSIGVSDGSSKIYFDTRTIYDVSGQLYKSAEDINKRPQRIGFQNEWSCTEGTPDTGGCYPGTFWMDDVYAHDSIARVEICDQPTYTGCTVPPEIQKINSWSATSINITYNLGSLGTTQYVYVVDNTGTPSAGFLINGPAQPGGGPNVPHSGLNGQSSLKGKAILK